MARSAVGTVSVRTRLLVNGMRENACREAVAEALHRVPGVREVEVSLFHATATVVHAPDCPVAAMLAAAEAVGYPARRAGREEGNA